MSEQQRILRHVRIFKDGCWIWTGAKDKDGYGVLTLPNPHRSCRVPRYAYTVFKGPIPEGMIVLHSCDTPACCNPEHLRVGTYTDNVHDCRAKGRLADTKGEKHGRAKLTEEIVRQIRAWTGSQGEAAKHFGVTQQCISKVVTRRHWGHVL